MDELKPLIDSSKQEEIKKDCGEVNNLNLATKAKIGEIFYEKSRYMKEILELALDTITDMHKEIEQLKGRVV
jgi:hypothetical protein